MFYDIVKYAGLVGKEVTFWDVVFRDKKIGLVDRVEILTDEGGNFYPAAITLSGLYKDESIVNLTKYSPIKIQQRS